MTVSGSHPFCKERLLKSGLFSQIVVRAILRRARLLSGAEGIKGCPAWVSRRGVSPVGEAVYRRVRQEVDFMEEDRELWPDIRALEVLVRSGELLDLAETLVPELQ